jgi:DNA-binding FadR family transcriptional regulator
MSTSGAPTEPRNTPAGTGDLALDLNVGPLAGMRRLTAVDSVRARIGMAVDLGLLQPGERLPNAPQIAAALEVGEMTVRRALVSLCEDGVLERRRGRDGGTMVAAEPRRGVVREIEVYDAASADVHQLIDQRLVLECGVAHLAAVNATDDDIAGLCALIDEMSAVQTWADYHGADVRFHRLLLAASGYPTAAAEMENVTQRLYRYYLPYPIEYLRESNEEHRELVAALRDHDPVAAVDVTRRHIEVLHDTMFMALIGDREPDGAGGAGDKDAE